MTETVHAALDEVVRRRQRLALVDFVPAIDLGDLDPDAFPPSFCGGAGVAEAGSRVIALFDTSALILAARQPEAGQILADALAVDEVALSEPILIEYLNGARNAAEYDRIELALRAARLVETTPADWQQALSVHRELARSGPAISAVSGCPT